MLFNSFEYIFFFIAVVILYYVMPHKFRWVFLLIASLGFYMAWDPPFIFLILGTIFVNYIFSIQINRVNSFKTKKILLTLCLIIDFGLLFFFKYLTFCTDTFNDLFNILGINYSFADYNVILPMGISFYTFQVVAYTVDVYRKNIACQKNFFKFSLFITFFPQLVAGPIERFSNLEPQLFAKKVFKVDNLILGLKIMTLGYFKKMVIADRVSIAVDAVFNNPHNFGGLAFIIATFLFAFQIYCDFSGYTDIAIGSAKILGIDLMQNFKQPYLSTSIKDFWRRWHISLSTWLKDYIYIPLGGSHCSKPRHYFNLAVTFLASGIWHGAAFTYIFWGLLHGFYQIIGEILNPYKEKFYKRCKLEKTLFLRVCKIICTFILVCFAWIFFRANSMNDAIYIVTNIFTGVTNWFNPEYVYNVLNSMTILPTELIASVSAIIILFITDLCTGKSTIHEVLDKKPFVLRFCYYFILISFILFFGVFYNAGEFIYFQF